MCLDSFGGLADFISVMHIMEVNIVYTSLEIGAVVCTTLIAIVGVITITTKASSRTVVVLAKERSKEQGLVVSVHA